MKLKKLIIMIYSITGLMTSIFTAFMTYIIIGKPIGTPMIIEITLSVLTVVPIIGLISYMLSNYLSKKFKFIQIRLRNIKNENFENIENTDFIEEINVINQDMNYLSKEMYSLIKDLKQKNINLSNLLISMAHDVKTPITIINGYIEEIQDQLISEEKMPSTLEHIKDEINFLDELTIDMIEFVSSLKTDKEKSSILLNDFVENEVFTILPKRKDLLLINDIDTDYIINFNRIDLKKICINLLSNAMRYTKDGYIKVSLNNDKIIFENNGDEIKVKYKEKIFEPFFTVSKNKNRKECGFGLGLSIVKNLSISNGYDCVLYSSNKKQTIFYLINL